MCLRNYIVLYYIVQYVNIFMNVLNFEVKRLLFNGKINGINHLTSNNFKVGLAKVIEAD